MATDIGVEMVEVGPRDGLQNEAAIVSTTDKAELIARAIAYGARRIEVTSFVNPRRVPQLADAEELVAMLPDRADALLALVERIVDLLPIYRAHYYHRDMHGSTY